MNDFFIEKIALFLHEILISSHASICKNYWYVFAAFQSHIVIYSEDDAFQYWRDNMTLFGWKVDTHKSPLDSTFPKGRIDLSERWEEIYFLVGRLLGMI